MLRQGELVRVSIRAPSNATAWVGWDGGRHPLVIATAPPSARLRAEPGTRDSNNDVDALPNSVTWASSLPARLLRAGAMILVARSGDTIRLPLPRIELSDADAPRLGVLGRGGSDNPIVARPTPGGTFKWFLLPGTLLEVTGRSGDFERVRFDDALEAWVSSRDIQLAPASTETGKRVAGNANVTSSDGWVDVAIPLLERPPFLVEERGRELLVTLYGTQSATDIIRYPTNDSFVRLVEWEQEFSDRLRYTVHLSEPPFGYQVLWANGALVLRVRRAPAVSQRSPLRGLTIAVDPGHPPAGATGPTGLYEGDVTLAVGRRLKFLLEQRGARVVLTRNTPSAVPLEERSAIALRANAHALVSIHVDAFPAGVNPFQSNGTATFFFHPHAQSLARDIQREVVKRLRLRDRGIYYDNLALVRPTWLPAVLVEGATMTIPAQEAALRTEQTRDAYARGIADGLAEFFRHQVR